MEQSAASPSNEILLVAYNRMMAERQRDRERYAANKEVKKARNKAAYATKKGLLEKLAAAEAIIKKLTT